MNAASVGIALALAALGHGWLWTGIVNRLHGCGWRRWLVSLLSGACIAAFVALPLAIAWSEWQRTAPAFNPFAGATWSAVYLAVCAAIGAASLVVKPWIESRRYDRSVLKKWTADGRDVAQALGRRPLDSRRARLLGRVPGNEALRLSVDRKLLAIPRLPAELNGLSIAHVSDLHMTGDLGRDFYEYLVRQVNDLRPDVIAVTGDIIENERCRGWLAPSLGQLCAPLGVYFVLGNHDAFIDAARTRTELAEAGLTYLGGRSLRADWNGAAVTLLGNELPWMSPAANIDELPSRSSAAPEFRLALCHTPDQFGWCRRAEVDLALAGHTHGGQVRLPLLGVVASPSLHGTRYACGVFRRGDTVLHVTRGVSGERPLRLRCPPELALLELRQPHD